MPAVECALYLCSEVAPLVCEAYVFVRFSSCPPVLQFSLHQAFFMSHCERAGVDVVRNAVDFVPKEIIQAFGGRVSAKQSGGRIMNTLQNRVAAAS